MAQLYFHCTSPDAVLPDRRGADLDPVEAHRAAVDVVRRVIATPGPEDWRGWMMLVLDENDDELFRLPFASVIGRTH
jgi:hypothetical protein